MITNRLLNFYFILLVAFATCASSTFADGYIDPVSGVEFVLIPGGCYEMGDTFGAGFKDEKPVHTVCLQDFYIAKFELTQEQWQRIMNKNPSFFKVCGGNCPVEEVSWNEIQDYISILNKQTGKTYRLPTEAEWEYAARSGGQEYKYAGTNNEASIAEYAWYEPNSNISYTHPVGQKKPNAIGLYDMSGNVWEWVSDWYSPNYYNESPKQNPRGPVNGSLRVYRGGSWGFESRYVRTSKRRSAQPDFRSNGLGFRLARTP